MKISIVLRTYNEQKHLKELLEGIESQACQNFDIEVLVVDSGSTDDTLNIASAFKCKIVKISKDEFTFGRSLNIGCSEASGDILVFVSGHCIPVNNEWISELVRPIAEKKADYSYGRQIGDESSKFSEQQLFKKYFPQESNIPQEGYFCNNANAALSRKAWERYRFDEDLTGLEDMELAKRLHKDGKFIAYVASAPVYHIHDETWMNIRNRYEREAFALQHIMPEVHLRISDFIRYVVSAILFDMSVALEQKLLFKNFFSIIGFRFMQFWGAYRGNHEHRKLSKTMKERYFYPR
jgi:glycosyltransferase involved in cell wall biosynthesis